MFSTRILLYVCALLLVCQLSRSSWGDVDPGYQTCIRSCTKAHCDSQLPKNAELYSPPLLQIVPLSCHELCNYGCIDSTSKARLQQGYPVVKYYGHWPFTRYFGLEEPASAIFSVLNALPHVLFLIKALKQKVVVTYMQRWLWWYALAASICWVCSALYHSKKVHHTTQLDLTSALGFILFGLFVAVRRIWGSGASTVGVTVLASSIVVAWCCRAYFMFQGMVSFDSHMKLSIGIVILTTTLWVLWVLYAQFIAADRKGMSAKYLCLLCQLWLIGASALEIFDFPPYWGIFDAHSLWHAVTVPLGFLWYRFWEQDRLHSEECGAGPTSGVSTSIRINNIKQD